jgi:BTB/POZ domain
VWPGTYWHSQTYIQTNFEFKIKNFPDHLTNSYTLSGTINIKKQNLFSGGSFGQCLKSVRKLILENLTEDGSCVLDVTVTVKFVKPAALFNQFHDPAVTRQNIVDNLSNMLVDAKYSDFVFIVKGKEFKVHRNVLAAASPVMDKMFSTEMEESRNQKCIIESIEPEIFESLLHFIYHGKLPVNFSEVSKDLYEAAHYYQMDLLQEICKKEVCSQLTVGNALDLFEWSHQYDLEELRSEAWEIVKR